MGWDDVDKSSGGFLKMEVGNNKLRIVSEPTIERTHWGEDKEKIGECLGEKCQYCLEKEPNVKYVFTIIDRKDGAVKTAKFPPSVAKKVRKFQKEGDYAYTGAVSPYDVTVTREGAGMETRYDVIPARENTPLTEAEKAAVESATRNKTVTLEEGADPFEG